MPDIAAHDQAGSPAWVNRLWQFTDVRHLFLGLLHRTASLFDGRVKIGLLAKTEHGRMLCRDVADVPVRALADLCLLYTSDAADD